MSLNIIFGVPVFKTKMPNHEEILKMFLPFIENENNFDFSTVWNCACKTTINNQEKNNKFPWNLFFQEIHTVLGKYASDIGLSENATMKLCGHAWANRYTRGQYQEVHNHNSHSTLISCAYMLKLPKNSARFTFYQSNYEIFPAHLKEHFIENNLFLGSSVTPPLDEGDIIFFPANLSHYVSSHNTDELRASISANFQIES